MSHTSIWPIDKTQSGATTSGQSGPGIDGNEGILHIPQSSKTRASPSDCLVSCLGHSLGKESYPSAKIQSVYLFYCSSWIDQRKGKLGKGRLRNKRE